MSERIAVIGLGYVGLPVAVEFSGAWPDVVGYDVNGDRVAALKGGGIRPVRSAPRLCHRPGSGGPPIRRTWRVPRSSSSPFRRPSTAIGVRTRPGTRGVRESRTQPPTGRDRRLRVDRVSRHDRGGLRSDSRACLRASAGHRLQAGLPAGAYQSRRYRVWLRSIVKVVAGEDEETLERVAGVYGSVVPGESKGGRPFGSPGPRRSSRTRSVI